MQDSHVLPTSNRFLSDTSSLQPRASPRRLLDIPFPLPHPVMDVAELRQPLCPPNSAAPPRDSLTDAQWATYLAILDGAIPALVPASKLKDPDTQIAVPDDDFDAIVQAGRFTPDQQGADAVADFLAARASETQAFRDDALKSLVTTTAMKKLVGLMDMLGTRLGSIFLTGYWTPIAQQPVRVREAILKSWAYSRVQTFRQIAMAYTLIAQKAHVISTTTLRQLAGYSDIPDKWEGRSGYDFEFIQLPTTTNTADSDEPDVITTDVVIIGSGPGGSVCAKNLAEAGHAVVVVEKGYSFHPYQLPMTQSSALEHLYDAGGVNTTDSGVSVVSGSVWGGGGSINWSVSLRTQDFVRDEWAAAGLPLFASDDYDGCLDRVCDFIGVGADAIRHNHRNRTLLEGARALGWKAKVCEQNTAGKEHYCGSCHLGCGLNEKRGPGVSWLPAAAAAGARFMEGVQVESILFADDGVTATGVEGVWTSRGPNGEVDLPVSERTQRRVIVKAKRVIVSAGSLRSPLLLMNSGIKNPHVGKNLHIHPVCYVSALYDEDTKPWEGGIITSVCTEFENLDGQGHGVKLEPTCMLPFLCLGPQVWTSGLDSKKMFLKYRNMATFISLTRDRDSGSVAPTPHSSTPRISYTASAYDRAHTAEGQAALAKICYATGAREIWAHSAGVPPFIPGAGRSLPLAEGTDPEFTDAEFAAWLAVVRERGTEGAWSSAHQMGTCRMGRSADHGVVDQAGAVFGAEGLYVADASVFPSASGVNPMVTTLAIADWISRGIAAGLAKS